jgi:hypothetical protein
MFWTKLRWLAFPFNKRKIYKWFAHDLRVNHKNLCHQFFYTTTTLSLSLSLSLSKPNKQLGLYWLREKMMVKNLALRMLLVTVIASFVLYTDHLGTFKSSFYFINSQNHKIQNNRYVRTFFLLLLLSFLQYNFCTKWIFIKDDSFSNFHFACRNLPRPLNGVLVKLVCEWRLITQQHCKQCGRYGGFNWGLLYVH